MASLKAPRPPPAPEEAAPAPAPKRARPKVPPAPQPSQAGRVVLNPADCDLDFDIDGNGLQGHALHEEGFAYCWSGARATVGITGGKYCFGCKIISEQAVDMSNTPPDQQHVCRVGISRGDDPVGNLGETANSFGFGGTGKFSNAGKFSDYGMKFGVGDTIVCAVNLEEKPLAYIGFSKNGKWLGIARQFDAGSRGLGVVDTPIRQLPWESAVFPHILLKNVVVQLQFSIEDGLIPEEGYKPWTCAIGDGKAIIGPSFSSPRQCEVMMMVGLPASGKTTWAEKWVKDHPEKRYVLLGTNLALGQMKVPGLLRKNNYSERFERLMDRATGIFNTLLARAARTSRNYILDQTNVYRSARNRKLKAFVNYHKVAVVIFPTPDELKIRADKRFKEMGKEVPAEAVNEMLANFVLPTSKNMSGSNEQFDEVIFPELSRGEAQKNLEEMKRLLGSPNLGSKSDYSPYSRESSVQSFSSPSIANKDTASVSNAYMQTYRPPVLLQNNDNQSPLQASTRYSGDYYSRLGDPGLSVPSNSPYDSHCSYGEAYPHQNEPRLYGSYNSPSPYASRNSFETSSIPIGESSPFGLYGVRDAYRKPEFESPSSYNRASRGYPVAQPAYNSPTAYLRDSGAHQPDHQAARGAPYEWHSPLQTSYGSSYGAPPHPPSGTRPPMNPPPGSWYH